MNQLSLIHISVMNHEKQEKPRNATSNTRKTPSAPIAAPIQKKQMVQKLAPTKKIPESSEETCDERSNVSEDLLDRNTQDCILVSIAKSHPSHRPPLEFIVPETEGMTEAFMRESTLSAGTEELHEEKDKVLSDLKEDLLVTMAFATALKRKLDDLYERVFKDDAATAVGGLTDTLGIVGTIAKEGVRLEKVTEYRFVKRTDN